MQKIYFNNSLFFSRALTSHNLCQCKIKRNQCCEPHSISDMQRHVPYTKPAVLLFVNLLCRGPMGGLSKFFHISIACTFQWAKGEPLFSNALSLSHCWFVCICKIFMNRLWPWALASQQNKLPPVLPECYFWSEFACLFEGLSCFGKVIYSCDFAMFLLLGRKKKKEKPI